MHTARLIITLLVLTLAMGCGSDEPTAEQLHAETIAARDTAKAAMDADDPAVAKRAAAQAEATAAKLRANAGELQPLSTTTKEPTPEAEIAAIDTVVTATLLAEAEEAALDARAYAELTTERRELDKQLGGLKARAYRGVRGVALTTTLKSLAFAARQADKVGFDKLPGPVQDQARTALDFVRRHAGDNVADAPGVVAEKVNWGAVADKLDTMAETLPTSATMTAATSLMLAGQFGFALAELETIDPDTLSDPDDRRGYHTLRAMAYRMNGYPRLAHEELRHVSDEPGEGDTPAMQQYGPQMQAGVHMLLFASHVHNGELIRADREFARATRAWPNNPMTVFLTGEKLTATGDYEAAATSLEAWAAKAGDEKIAARVAEHARAMRDAKGNPKPLLTDPKFLLEMTRHYLTETAAESPVAAKARDMLDTAADFGRGLLEKLPGVSPAEDKANDAQR